MASGVNKVILVGNLGADPEIRYTPSGAAVANFRMATTESWKDSDGQRQDRTEWHKIVVWGKLAELCGEYLAKGRMVYVEGKLQTRQWDDRDGNKRYTTEVQGREVTFLGGRSDASNSNHGGQAAQNKDAGSKDFDYGPPPMDEDDVPF